MIRRGSGFTTFEVAEADGSTRLIGTCGRFAQTLRALIAAGSAGITSMTVVQTWGLRLSHYIWRLRNDHRLMIETQREEHTGPFEGVHGRYVLLDRVRVLGEDHPAAAVSPASSLDARGTAA